MRTAAFIRNASRTLKGGDGRWIALFSVSVGLALAWTYTPMFLAPIECGMGDALFGTDGSPIAFFTACALTYLANAALSGKPHATAVFGYGLPHALLGVAGGVLLAAAFLTDTSQMLAATSAASDGIEIGGSAAGSEAQEASTAWLPFALGVAGAALAAFSSTCAVLQASRLLKRLSPSRSVMACTGAFVVAATIVVVAAFVTGPVACIAISFVPLLTWGLGRLAEARVPFDDLAKAGERSLTLVPLKMRDAWRYGAISLGIFLMGSWALNNAGQYNHLPQDLSTLWIAVQSVAVVAAFVACAAVLNATSRPIGYDLLCRVCVPAVTLGILLEFLPEANAGYLDDLAVCLTFVGLMLGELMVWVIQVCTARNPQDQGTRAFAVVRSMTCIGVMAAYVVTQYFTWAPLDKPKVAMTIGFLVLMVCVVCLPSADAKVISISSAQPAALRDLDQAKRDQLSGLIVSHGLTAREAEVFALLVDDLDPAAIAQHLGVSGATVHTHVSHVYTKFGVHSRKELERAVEAAKAAGKDGPKG